MNFKFFIVKEIGFNNRNILGTTEKIKALLVYSNE